MCMYVHLHIQCGYVYMLGLDEGWKTIFKAMIGHAHEHF